jgi:hypothetical protein
MWLHCQWSFGRPDECAINESRTMLNTHGMEIEFVQHQA